MKSLQNISQMGSFPQLGVKIKNVWNHHLVSSRLYFYVHPILGTAQVRIEKRAELLTPSHSAISDSWDPQK